MNNKNKFPMYGIGTITSQGIVLDEVEDQIFDGKHWIHKSFIKNNEEINDDEIFIQIKNLLIEENGNKNITLYHGTDSKTFDKIKKENIFGHDKISFLTLDKLEAKEYARNKAQYRNIENGKILKIIMPSWRVKYNDSTNEYETPYILENKNNIWTPTKESVLRVEKQNLLSEKEIEKTNNNKEYNNLLERLDDNFCLKDSDYHNKKHWNRVFKLSKYIRELNGIESNIFKYFAMFHDVGRTDEDYNQNHGENGSKLAIKYRKYINLTDEEFEKLIFACKWHTKPLDTTNKFFKDKIINICWDADKLDLVRLNIKINKEKLLNNYSKLDSTIDFAKKLFHNIDLPIDKDLMYSNTKIIINQNDFKRKETNKEIKIKEEIYTLNL